MSQTTEITLAAGCFWCYEAIFQQIRGISSVKSGYAGSGDEPTYEQVSTGTSGFAEAVQLAFDPEAISLEVILDIFWHMHDPTSLNRQGNDMGPQYRSAIFYHNDEQKKIAEQSLAQAQTEFDKPIVTEINELQDFYPAEDYHQNYYQTHQSAPYCQIVIAPKLHKILEKYSDLTITT